MSKHSIELSMELASVVSSLNKGALNGEEEEPDAAMSRKRKIPPKRVLCFLALTVFLGFVITIVNALSALVRDALENESLVEFLASALQNTSSFRDDEWRERAEMFL